MWIRSAGDKRWINIILVIWIVLLAAVYINIRLDTRFEGKATFKLERCNCSRSLSQPSGGGYDEVKFSDTSCGRDAFYRGSHQRVAGFSFYGDSSSEGHRAKQFFAGIEENLRLLRSEYGESWSMRLYYDLPR